MLAVDGAKEDPDELFDRAHSAEQIGDIAEAERLYRLLMKSDPTEVVQGVKFESGIEVIKMPADHAA